MDIKTRKLVLRMMTYGVYILTSKKDNSYIASTVTWVSQSSFKPPLLIVCLKKDTITHDIVKESGRFILHILNEDQKEIASNFIKHTIHKGGKLNGYKYTLINELPVITSIPAYIECNIKKYINLGDHPLFIAEITNIKLISLDNPLELRKTGWYYGG